MNTEVLGTFLAVIESGSFTRAARRMNLSQSAVSSRIAALEHKVGQPLFVRRHDRVDLTPAGQGLVPYARRMIALEEQALKSLDIVCPLERLVVASVHTYYDFFLRPILDGYRERYPARSTRVVLKHSREVINGVLDGRYDVGYSHHPVRSPGILCRKVASDELLLLHRDPRYGRGVTVADLRRMPLVYSEFLDTPVAEELFGKPFLFELEIDVGSKVLPYIREQDRISMLPRRMVQDLLDSGELFSIPTLDFLLPPLEYFLLYDEAKGFGVPVRDWLQV
ncbi:MAG: hypothetical protein CSA35_05800 [Dethiosulfovibrio peptidovorans]|nr:MAG: hypothetical protein CSA35_05800 [Dethiosulfovibrio peptidovorans]